MAVWSNRQNAIRRPSGLQRNASRRSSSSSYTQSEVPLITFSPPSVVSAVSAPVARSEEHTSELQSRVDLVCRLLLEKKKKKSNNVHYRHTYKLQCRYF